MKACLEVAAYAIEFMKINTKALDDKRYDLIFSVEEVNSLVNSGMPFRDAYKHVAQKIIDGNFVPVKKIKHTHEGSIGNLCNDRIVNKMNQIIYSFEFEKVDQALARLIE